MVRRGLSVRMNLHCASPEFIGARHRSVYRCCARHTRSLRRIEIELATGNNSYAVAAPVRSHDHLLSGLRFLTNNIAIDFSAKLETKPGLVGHHQFADRQSRQEWQLAQIMTRAAAINRALAGANKLWAGTVNIHPNAKTAPHHHGELESIIYIISGRARMRWGERLEFLAEAGPGDFIFVPPFVPHQEINANSNEPLACVVVRS